MSEYNYFYCKEIDEILLDKDTQQDLIKINKKLEEISLINKNAKEPALDSKELINIIQQINTLKKDAEEILHKLYYVYEKLEMFDSDKLEIALKEYNGDRFYD